MTNEAAWVTLLRKTRLLASTPALHPIDDGEGFQTVGILPDRYVSSLSSAFDKVVEPFVAEFYGELVGDADFYGDKILSHNDLAFAVEQFPDAVFVELVRDLRDVIVSTYAFEKKQPTAWQDAPFELRHQHLDEFFQATERLLDGRQRHVVRYEDLVSDGPATMARLFEAIGLPPSDDVTSYLEGPATDLFKTQGTSNTPGASIGRWRTELTEDQRALLTEALGHHLRRFGYEA